MTRAGAGCQCECAVALLGIMPDHNLFSHCRQNPIMGLDASGMYDTDERAYREEPQKAGIPPAEAVAFVKRCRDVHGLDIDGLMAIPPDGLPPGAYFAHLAELAQQAGVATLSMGMSGDFETAIAMGATHVRVGSALFGHRPTV